MRFLSLAMASASARGGVAPVLRRIAVVLKNAWVATSGPTRARRTDSENTNLYEAFNMEHIAPVYAAAAPPHAGHVASPRSTTFAVGRPSTHDPPLPPYAPPGHTLTVADDGTYDAHEPPTMARELFKYGFFLPLFWA